MYTLTWNIEDSNYCCCGNYNSLLLIYDSLRIRYKDIKPTRDMYIKCVNEDGKAIDLLNGRIAIPGREKTLIVKGSFFETRKYEYHAKMKGI